MSILPQVTKFPGAHGNLRAGYGIKNLKLKMQNGESEESCVLRSAGADSWWGRFWHRSKEDQLETRHLVSHQKLTGLPVEFFGFLRLFTPFYASWGFFLFFQCGTSSQTRKKMQKRVRVTHGSQWSIARILTPPHGIGMARCAIRSAERSVRRRNQLPIAPSCTRGPPALTRAGTSQRDVPTFCGQFADAHW